jgi:hypothetical protein
MDKKAQMTLFVIIGLVVLLIVGIFFIVLKNNSEPKTIDEAYESVSLTPIDAYVSNCISLIGKEAITKIGVGGGYIHPEKFGINANPSMPTMASAVSLFEESEIVPYWFYLKSSNACRMNCVLASEKPPLRSSEGSRSIESQLADYLEENILVCLNNMSSFDKGLTATIVGKPKAEVIVKDDVVSFYLTQKIDAVYEGKELSLEKFKSDVFVSLKKGYDVLSQIVEFSTSDSTRFFEKKTMHIVGSYGMGNNPSLPPIGGGTELGEASVGPWQLMDVNEKIKLILEDHIPIFTVDNTQNSYILITPDPSFNGIYNDFIIDVPSLDNPEDYSINFLYSGEWPIYLDVIPESGGMIRASTRSLLSGIPVIESLLKVSIKDFAYDISYPIIIIVRDESAFEGEGFVFQAAMEINIRANLPINISGDSPITDGFSSSLFCDYEQKVSSDITINIVDDKGKPVVDASIMYDCGGESCFIGESDNNGVVVEKFPLCLNGLVNAQHKDYLFTPQKLTVSKGTSSQITVPAKPYRDVELSLKKIKMEKLIMPPNVEPDHKWVLNPLMISELSSDDKAMVVMQKRPAIGENDFAASAQISEKTSVDKKTVRLVEGEYSFIVMLMTNLGEDSVSKKVIKVPLVDSPEKEEDWLTIDSLFSSGELIIDESKGFVTISSSDLESGKITLFIPYVESDDLDAPEELATYYEAMQNLTINANTRQILLPVYG